ncbi:hypothetical protein [Streptomyces sp. NPDC059991]|uniref:hypothetical protein n=1 Tax=unclassified Streptomyces TaxID=2593676 RepID=UPI00369F36EA
MATKPKRTAREIAARTRAMERALGLNAARLRREKELTELAADFLETRELEADVLAVLEEDIARLRTEAASRCEALHRQGATVVVSMTAKGEGAGRIAQRLGVGVGEVRQLRDSATPDAREAGAPDAAERERPGAARRLEGAPVGAGARVAVQGSAGVQAGTGGPGSGGPGVGGAGALGERGVVERGPGGPGMG